MFESLEQNVSDKTALSHIFQFQLFSSSLVNNLQSRFNGLKSYLDTLLTSNNTFLPPTTTQEFNKIANEAKKEFKESALRIINRIKHRFEEEKRSHLVPERLLSQTIEDTKQRLFLNYNRLMKGLYAAYAITNKEIPPQAQDSLIQDVPVKKKLKPGKTKFPKKARQILEAWYKAHADDPFPSHEDKQRLADESGITVKQVKCWFINVRRKTWKKMNEDTNFKKELEQKLAQNNEPQ